MVINKTKRGREFEFLFPVFYSEKPRGYLNMIIFLTDW